MGGRSRDARRLARLLKEAAGLLKSEEGRDDQEWRKSNRQPCMDTVIAGVRADECESERDPLKTTEGVEQRCVP